MIGKITAETKEEIRKKTAEALPDDPARSGYRPSQLKKYFGSLALLDDRNSFLTEINRIVDEINNNVVFNESLQTTNQNIEVLRTKLDELSKIINIAKEEDLDSAINKLNEVFDFLDSIGESAKLINLLNDKVDNTTFANEKNRVNGEFSRLEGKIDSTQTSALKKELDDERERVNSALNSIDSAKPNRDELDDYIPKSIATLENTNQLLVKSKDGNFTSVKYTPNVNPNTIPQRSAGSEVYGNTFDYSNDYAFVNKGYANEHYVNKTSYEETISQIRNQISNNMVNEITKDVIASEVPTNEPNKLPYAVINKLGGMSYRVESENKLKLPNVAPVIRDGTTLSIDNGVLYINGNSTGVGYTYRPVETFIHAGTYKVINDYKAFGTQMLFYDINGSKIAETSYDRVSNVVLTKDVYSVGFWVTSRNYNSSDYFRFMVIEETKDDSIYKPYFEPYLVENLPSSLSVMGNNIFDSELEYGFINISNGDYVSSQDWTRPKRFMSVKPNTNYFVSVSGYSTFVIILYNEKKEYIGYESHSIPYGFKTNANTHYIKFYCENRSENNIMINAGDSFKAFEPYFKRDFLKDSLEKINARIEGRGYSLGLGTDSKTYNYIDFNRVKAIIKCQKVDLGTLDWNGENGRYYAIINDISKDNVTSQDDSVGFLNDKYSRSNVYNLGLETSDKFIGVGNIDYTNHGVYVKDKSYSSISSVKNGLIGIYLIYELETPVEVDISDILDSELFIALKDRVVIENEQGNDSNNEAPVSITYQVKGGN